MLQALCGLVERYATVVDVEKHANTLPKPLSTQECQRIHVWGPVLEQDGKRVGALGEAGSVLEHYIIAAQQPYGQSESGRLRSNEAHAGRHGR